MKQLEPTRSKSIWICDSNLCDLQVEEKAAASEEWVEEGGDVIDSTGGLGIVLVAGEGGEFGAWKVRE